jgi:hypothetical protein
MKIASIVGLIVAGNFVKNKVMKCLGADIVGDLANADHAERRGLVIGNHYYLIADAITALAKI